MPDALPGSPISKACVFHGISGLFHLFVSFVYNEVSLLLPCNHRSNCSPFLPLTVSVQIHTIVHNYCIVSGVLLLQGGHNLSYIPYAF